MIDELAQNFQNLKNENEQNKKSLAKASQEKDESVENIKKQYERQKQKDLDLIREYVQKVYLNCINDWCLVLIIIIIERTKPA